MRRPAVVGTQQWLALLFLPGFALFMSRFGSLVRFVLPNLWRILAGWLLTRGSLLTWGRACRCAARRALPGARCGLPAC